MTKYRVNNNPQRCADLAENGAYFKPGDIIDIPSRRDVDFDGELYAACGDVEGYILPSALDHVVPEVEESSPGTLGQVRYVLRLDLRDSVKIAAIRELVG